MSDQFSYYYPRDLGIFRTWGQTSTMGILGIWEICQFFNGPFPLHCKIFQMQFSILIFIKDLGISYCGVSVVAKKAKSNLCEQWKVSLIRLACYFEPLNLRHLRIAIWERWMLPKMDKNRGWYYVLYMDMTGQNSSFYYPKTILVGDTYSSSQRLWAPFLMISWSSSAVSPKNLTNSLKITASSPTKKATEFSLFPFIFQRHFSVINHWHLGFMYNFASLEFFMQIAFWLNHKCGWKLM